MPFTILLLVFEVLLLLAATYVLWLTLKFGSRLMDRVFSGLSSAELTAIKCLLIVLLVTGSTILIRSCVTR